MVKFHYGDIVKVNLNPVKGHEEGNYRPVVIINRDEYPLPGGINIILPITTHGNNLDKVRPGEIVLDNRTETKGAVMCYQPRTLDLSDRDARVVEHLPDDILKDCVDTLMQFIY